jgi:integrase
MVITAMNTGMRGGEIRGLKWEHIDYKAGFIRLPAEVTKEKKAKNIPMNRSEAFATICKRAGLPHGQKGDGITFHDIRRTVKTNMLKAGVIKEYRDMILGHSLQGMDVHYIVEDESILREAMKKYTDWLDNQLTSLDQTLDQADLTNLYYYNFI